MSGRQAGPEDGADVSGWRRRRRWGTRSCRRNVRHAGTEVVQAKRARVVGEMPDWQELREAGKQIREHTMENLDFYLEQFEANCTRAGGRRALGAVMRRTRGGLLSAGEGERVG